MRKSSTGYYTLNKRGKVVPMKPDCRCGKGVITQTLLGQRMCGQCADSPAVNKWFKRNLESYMGRVMDDLAGRKRL